MSNGKFVISLDFEIYWGLRDAVKLENYKENLLGVRQVIPLSLALFKKYDIHATFAIVGFLYFDNKTELLNNLPLSKPDYNNTKLSPYNDYLKTIGEDETADEYHFAGSLINQVKQAEQEIASHTFSHYYCLEKGQTKEAFRQDLIAAKNIAGKRGIECKSIIFPRNQCNKEYLTVCRQMGFTAFRGNEKSWLFSSESLAGEIFLRRPFRLVDAYVNLSGNNCYSIEDMKDLPLVNIPSSRFLRPYSKRFSVFEKLRLKRITNSMTYAAKNNLMYHLWWHPHNFGINIKENFLFLEKILLHYSKLNTEYNFKNVTMQQLADEVSRFNK